MDLVYYWAAVMKTSRVFDDLISQDIPLIISLVLIHLVFINST